MKLRVKIGLIFGLTILLCVVVIGLYSVNKSFSSSISNVSDSMRTSSKLAANQIAGNLKDYMNIAAVTGEDLILTGNKSAQEKADRISELAQKYGFTSGNVLDPSGVSYADGTDFSDREYVSKALAGVTNVSGITLSKLTGKYGFSVAAPLMSGDSVEGVAYYRMDIDFMMDIIDNITISENSYAYIVDENGDVIVHKNQEYIGELNIREQDGELGRIAEQIAQGESGNDVYTFNGQKIICGFCPIENTNGWCVVIAAPESDFSAQMYQTSKGLIIVDVLALLFASVIAFVFAGSMARAVNEVKEGLVKLTEGDLSSKINRTNRNDEIGTLQNAAASLQEMFASLVVETNRILGGMAEYRLNQPDMKDYPGEFDSLSFSVNSIKAILKQLIKEVQESASSVGVGSSQLADAADALSQGTTIQAGSIQQVVLSIGEMAEHISRNSDNGRLVGEKLKSLDGLIREGNTQMTELLAVVKEVEEMSSDIQKIVATIDSIAFQTNILALNASVEAARAGENGKGFAVVADEVGNLAAKSGEASKQTAELIENCIRGIEKATENAQSTFECLSSIVKNSAEISQAFEEIVQDTTEQAKKSNSIEKEITNISDVVQNNTATAQQTAAATQVLSEQATSLSSLIQQFDV